MQASPTIQIKSPVKLPAAKTQVWRPIAYRGKLSDEINFYGMKNYNKDYSTKTADEWFSLKKWTGFLMTIPLGRTIQKDCDCMRDVLALRSTASTISNSDSSKRKFSVTTDVDNELRVFITAIKK